MDKVREYERASLECSQIAANASITTVRAQYLKLAEMWRKLAEERRAFLQSITLDR